MNRRTAELCPNWSGDGDVCPCALFDLEPPQTDADRLASGETCVLGMPMSCGDAHTGGHCARPITEENR